MTQTSYLLAWLIYILTCIGLCLTAWQLVKTRIRWPGYVLGLPLLVLLLTPYFSDAHQSRLAPAILTILFESAFGDMAIALKAMMAVGVLLIPSILVALLIYARRNMAK
jgi:hypothetical protein